MLTGAESDEPQVVDGQQRLATTMILIAAIRDYLTTNDFQTKGDEVSRQYLATRDLRSDELLPRLRLNSVDNEFFVNRIITPPEDRAEKEPVLESHRRIDKAAQLAKTRVKTIAVSAGAKAVDSLIDWVDFINRKAKVIRVRRRS